MRENRDRIIGADLSPLSGTGWGGATPCASVGWAPLGAGWLVPMVMDADHNIPPCLEKQLVLQLKLRVEVLELRQRLPRSVLRRQAEPLDQDVPNISTLLGAKNSRWCG